MGFRKNSFEETAENYGFLKTIFYFLKSLSKLNKLVFLTIANPSILYIGIYPQKYGSNRDKKTFEKLQRL